MKFIQCLCIFQFSYMMMFEPYFKSRKRGNEVWYKAWHYYSWCISKISSFAVEVVWGIGLHWRAELQIRTCLSKAHIDDASLWKWTLDRTSPEFQKCSSSCKLVILFIVSSSCCFGIVFVVGSIVLSKGNKRFRTATRPQNLGTL